MRPTEKRAITFEASRCTRSDSQIPWDKVSIDYLSTEGWCRELQKVIVGVRVGALRARRRRRTHNNGNAENNIISGDDDNNVPLLLFTRMAYLY